MGMHACIAIMNISVADPEGDPRVPWIPPFRLNIEFKTGLPATYRGPTVSPS